VSWQGADPAPDLPAIAELLAPVLWFSSDEPLIILRNGRPIPHPHPADAPSVSAVVYYQATDIVLRGRERVVGTGESDAQFFAKTDHFVLKYFFYYDEDRGLSPHAHDLEAISVLVHLERTAGGSNMKKPLITSRTRFWAPNPTASPTTPAPARIGVTSKPISRKAITRATLQMRATAARRMMPTIVFARFSNSPGNPPA